MALFNDLKEDQNATFEALTECIESMGVHVSEASTKMVKIRQLYAKIVDDLDDIGEAANPAVEEYVTKLMVMTDMMSELHEIAQGLSEAMEMEKMQRADSNRNHGIS